MIFGCFTRVAALATTTVRICGENPLSQHIVNGGTGPVLRLRKPDDDDDAKKRYLWHNDINCMKWNNNETTDGNIKTSDEYVALQATWHGYG